ncbi:MAG: PepSY domain-containing protein [Arenimonas sp.]
MTRYIAPAMILLAALIAAPVSADQRKGNGNNDQPRAETKTSLTDSVRKVERQTGGEVLSAEPMQQRDGRQVNRVKVLTNDGRVRVVQVDTQQDRSKKPTPAPRPQNNADSKDGGDPNQF